MSARQVTFLAASFALAASLVACSTASQGPSGNLGGPMPTSTATAMPTSTSGSSGSTGTSAPETPGSSGSADDSGPTTTMAALPDGGLDANGRILAECQGFALTGLKYSPGGTTLPNKCAAFDATTNNPYAVRCIDAMPNYKTSYPGDEYCILPPPPDQGLQIGFHPQGSAAYWQQMYAGDMSGYSKPSADWVVQPNQEITQNYHGAAGNTAAHNYYRMYFRMRTGSHHNIITLQSGNAADGWEPLSGPGAEALPGLFDTSVGSLIGIIGGQQRPSDQYPTTLDKPTEDSGYYLTFPANPIVLYNMHYINAGKVPVLREGWVNLWWETDARLLVSWFMGLPGSQLAGLNVQPGTVADLHYSWSIPSGANYRLMRVFGHRHFWTTNFTSWIQRSGATTPEIIYQAFDWSEMPTYAYNSEVINPVANATTHVDGAASGIIKLNGGDKLHFNCHIEYTDARATTNANAPTPESNGALHFANEAFKAEMCIEYGNVQGGSLGLPSDDSTPLPSVATK